jgi:hypothetical protein
MHSAEHPADLYYFSELTVNVFGIANVCNKPTTMLAYGYTTLNMRGEMGGNNVASLLLKGLIDLGRLRDDKMGKCLSIIMDNCGGQNKNNFVLCVALWLVELKEAAQKMLVTVYSTS